MAEIVKSATDLAEKISPLSNVYRTIILVYLMRQKEASWSDIKQFIEKLTGSVNPNTLHFHLKALIESQYIMRSGSDEKSIYVLGNLPEYISTAISKEIIEKNQQSSN